MNINFSRNLAILRKSQGITQEAMAEKCGVSRQAVTKWECGNSTPDLYKSADIAEIFGVTLDELLHGKFEEQYEDHINQNYAEHLESKMDSILAELRKNNKDILDEYQGFNDGGIELEDEDENVPTEAFTYWGLEEAQKGNYTAAIEYLEQALVRGDYSAAEILIGIYQEILSCCLVDEDEYKYSKQELEFAQKIQKYGKIMECEIKQKLKFM